jgi:putative hemolysin
VIRPLVALSLLVCAAVAIAVFLPAATAVQAGSSINLTQPDGVDLSKAADYCVKKGGEVDDRAPYYNTNADQQDWFRLSGERQFCKFTSKKNGSRIFVLLSTLYTDQPSLAALAYYAEVQLGSCNGNPASCYCSQLGGSDLFGGVNANGGGWVKKSDPVDTVLEACIFPDMSTIDSWGLAYHSAGIIRGKDLSKVLRYQNPYGAKH